VAFKSPFFICEPRTAAKVTIVAGVNQSQSVEQSSSQGTIWNKSKISKESRTTHVNPTFEGDVNFHSKSVSMQRRAGSGAANIISDSTVAYVDMLDQSDSSSKSQKSLSMGAALVLKLALTLSMGNPFAASSIPSAMASAGYSTLCSEAMVCLVENDGNPGRAMHALGERNIGKSIVRSVATAGLTKGIGGLCGVTDALTIPNLARQYLIQSAITTTMSVVVDKQNIGDAMRQGATSAVVNTVAAWSAGQIGDLASEKMGAAKISSPTQTGLHFATGAVAGGISAAILGGDIGREALARGAGAVVGHKLAETFGDMGMETNTAAQLGNIGTVGLAMLIDQDVMAAYQGSCNAIEHNFSRHRLNPIENLVKSVKKGMEVKEGEAATPEQEAYERGRQIYVKDSLELACQLNGGPLSEESAERIVSNANELYATKYTTDLCGSMIGKTIVGASELIPGMHGINKAWMGVVNHTRGDLSDGQLADEILGGIHSALTDAAFCVATAGAAHYYRNAKMVVKGVVAAKEAAKVGVRQGKASMDGKLFQEHHIISDKHDLVRNHDLIRFAGFNLQSRANKMLLPTKRGAEVSTTARSIHDGRHIELVHERLAKDMTDVVTRGQPLGWTQSQYNNELMKIISKEKTALKSGDRILNINHHPKATDGGRVVPAGDKK